MKRTETAALVAGGGRGLGREIARRLASEGWHVGVLARNLAELDETVRIIEGEGGIARSFPADLLDDAMLRRALASFREWTGVPGVFALVGSAGQLQGLGPVGVVETASWWGDIELAIRGNFQMIAAALPILSEADSASVSLLVGPGHNGELANASGYGLAQAGIARMVESLARELQPRKIPIFAVNPGLVPTPLMQHLLDSTEGRRWLPRLTEAFAEGKEVGPEVVAEMVAWLSQQRPTELSGRVVSAMITPEILESRLARIATQGNGLLRLI